MRTDHLDALKAWFDRYARSHLTGVRETDGPLLLKIAHTDRVCKIIGRLGRSMALSDGHLRLAESIALMHDVGRFDQYRRHGTFNDRLSADHAALGIRVLQEQAVLDPLPAAEKGILLDAVRLHNAPALPADTPAASRPFVQLIRDADKLDIWRVFADYFGTPRAHHPTIIQDLPDRPTWEEPILRAITEQRMAALKDMRSLNDFKLLQLSWVFDLNVAEAFVIARDSGHLAAIARTLPGDDAVYRAVGLVMARLDERAAAAGEIHGTARGPLPAPPGGP